MVDYSLMRLGKRPAIHDERTLQLANYITGALPPIPKSANWASKVKIWGMMLNDKMGDCTIAGVGHAVQTWTANASKEITIPDATILAAYEAISGYTPSNPNSDAGCYEADVLKFWQKKGIGGDKLGAYVDCEPKNKQHVQAAIDIFGGVYIGLSLPISAQRQTVWSVPPGGTTGNGTPGSWGGHAVWVVEYDQTWLTCVTWGALKKMTWGFWTTYCDESHVLVSSDFLNGKKQTPLGFNMQQLLADLQLVKN
jgi:hypothetical protein